MEVLRVLVADDEPGMRTGVVRALRDFTVQTPTSADAVAVRVDTAESGEEALDLINREAPDILLLDHKLPGMSGLDLLEQLGERTADILVVIITAYASIETAVTATKRGAYDFLPKPFTPDELKSVVHKAGVRRLLLRQTRQLEEEKRRVRFEFIRVLTHELKAPLNAVEGYLLLLKDQTLGEIPAPYQEMISRATLRIEGMRKLIMDLLDITRIESGAWKRQIQEWDLAVVAREALETVQAQAAARNITVDLHAPAPVTLQGDRGEVDMILNNLLTNAVKYNRDGGRVDITVEAQGEQACLRVADTGIGMTPADQAKLFGEFTRIRNAKTRGILGSGLGLSILRKLVDLYHGDIVVESEPDQGTTFLVTLARGGQQEESP